MRRIWPPLVLLAAAVGLWELVVRATHTPDYLFPAPSEVASSLGGDAGLLWHATLVTLREIVLGYLLAVAIALVLAGVLHFSAALRRALLPILVLSQTVPTVLLAPILAAILVLSALALALYALVSLAEHLVDPWESEARNLA